MIDKDSSITKDFIKRIFEATHKRWYVEHALKQIKSEDKMKTVIDYLKDNPSAAWQDIEYLILSVG